MKNALELNIRNPIARLSIAGIFIILMTLGLRQCASSVDSAPDFAPGGPGPEVTIEIMPGETGSQIAEKLFQAQVVKSALSFFRVAVADERSARIAPGEHRVETKIPARTALQQLLDAERIPNLIVVRDGERVNEIIESIESFGISKSEILKAISREKAPSPFNTRKLEGFLYPAHYSFNKGVQAEEIISTMLQAFSSATKDVSWQYKNFSAFELLTIASLVQTEGTPEDFGRVARVIYNRLEQGMPLQFDSTVHYALNRRGEIRVSINDTKVSSRYNTFIYRGLPPGPIGSPNLKAITATLQPSIGDWLYFVTVKPGDTRFTSSYDQFLEWKALYKKNYQNGLFE